MKDTFGVDFANLLTYIFNPFNASNIRTVPTTSLQNLIWPYLDDVASLK